jgi:hypothetical protein
MAEKCQHERHDVALWAGLTALFTNLSAITLIDIVDSNDALRAAGIVVASVIVGATVYSKQRWDDAKGKGETVNVDQQPRPPDRGS